MDELPQLISLFFLAGCENCFDDNKKSVCKRRHQFGYLSYNGTLYQK